MTTVYVLSLATDYEGESLMGVYDTHEDAEDAAEAYLVEADRELCSFEQFFIRPVAVGAPAELRF